MWYGLAISTVVHLALMGLALVSIQTTQPLKLPEPEAVAVAIISPDDLTRLMKGDRAAKANESSAKEGPQAPTQPKEAVKPPPTPPPSTKANTPPPPPAEDEIAKKLAALETPPPPPAKVEPPPPPPAPKQPTADEKKKVEDEIALELEKAALAKKEAEAKAKAEADAKAKAEAEAKAKAKAEAEAKAKAAREKAAREKAAREKAAREKAQRDAAEKAKREAEAKKNAFDPSKIATAIENDTTPQALQNKAPPKGAPSTTQKSTPDAPSKAPNAGAPDGRDNANTASLAAAVRARIIQQLATCWNINAGLEGANRLVPKVYFELNKDGSLRGQPRLENPQNTPEFNNAAEAAMRAVVECSTQKKFADLPAEYYPYWERNRIDFNPASMFR